MENSEIQVWLDFSLKSCYLNKDDYINKSEEVGKLLNHIIEYPEKYLRKNEKFA